MNIIPTRLDMIKAITPGSIGAEIGVYRGDFSLQIMEQTRVAKLYLVDPWVKQEGYNDTINEEDQEGHYQETLRKMMKFIRDGEVEIVRGFSARVAHANTSIPPLDWAFIDAYHSYEAALEDLTAWSKRLKPDGILFAHDYFEGPRYGHDGHEWSSGVVAACATFCEENGWEVTAVTEEDLPTARLENRK